MVRKITGRRDGRVRRRNRGQRTSLGRASRRPRPRRNRLAAVGGEDVEGVDRDGAGIELVDAAEEEGVDRFVMLSAMNADQPEESPDELHDYLVANKPPTIPRGQATSRTPSSARAHSPTTRQRSGRKPRKARPRRDSTGPTSRACWWRRSIPNRPTERHSNSSKATTQSTSRSNKIRRPVRVTEPVRVHRAGRHTPAAMRRDFHVLDVTLERRREPVRTTLLDVVDVPESGRPDLPPRRFPCRATNPFGDRSDPRW